MYPQPRRTVTSCASPKPSSEFAIAIYTLILVRASELLEELESGGDGQEDMWETRFCWLMCI
jgi:hypothetical protein